MPSAGDNENGTGTSVPFSARAWTFDEPVDPFGAILIISALLALDHERNKVTSLLVVVGLPLLILNDPAGPVAAWEAELKVRKRAAQRERQLAVLKNFRSKQVPINLYSLQRDSYAI